MNRIAIQYITMLQAKWPQKLIVLLVSVTIRSLVTTSEHMHAYRYPLFESGMKRSL